MDISSFKEGVVLLARKRSSERMAMALTRRMETDEVSSEIAYFWSLGADHRIDFRDQRISSWVLFLGRLHREAVPDTVKQPNACQRLPVRLSVRAWGAPRTP